MIPTSRREIAWSVWMAALGKPYRWGGDDPVIGFDCSGLVVEGLKAAGLLPRTGDWTAATLALKFPARTVIDPPAGCLLFWHRGVPAKIGHVEISLGQIDGVTFTIGASGGGSSTTSDAAAASQNAYVKIRPAVLGWVQVADPFP